MDQKVDFIEMKFINFAPFEYSKNYDLSNEKEITILIKTLERKVHLIQLLDSIQHFGFRGAIIIADDSKVPYGQSVLAKFPMLDIQYINLPYDAGTAEGRNRMLAVVETPYFLLCDDDFVFDRRTRIPLMKKLLEENQLDLLAGVFIQHNRKTRKGKYLLKINPYLNRLGWVLPSNEIYEYHAGITIKPNEISLYSIPYSNPVTICDLTHNFFIAKTEKVKSFGGWNPVLKGGEHQNFFIRAKLAGLKVGTTQKCGVIHDQWTENSKEYQNLRNRGNEYQMLALAEFGVTRLENYKQVLGGTFGI